MTHIYVVRVVLPSLGNIVHVDKYTQRKRLHTKYSIVHMVYLPFDNVWCLTAMGKKTMSDNRII